MMDFKLFLLLFSLTVVSVSSQRPYQRPPPPSQISSSSSSSSSSSGGNGNVNGRGGGGGGEEDYSQSRSQNNRKNSFQDPRLKKMKEQVKSHAFDVYHEAIDVLEAYLDKLKNRV